MNPPSSPWARPQPAEPPPADPEATTVTARAETTGADIGREQNAEERDGTAPREAPPSDDATAARTGGTAEPGGRQTEDEADDEAETTQPIPRLRAMPTPSLHEDEDDDHEQHGESPDLEPAASAASAGQTDRGADRSLREEARDPDRTQVVRATAARHPSGEVPPASAPSAPSSSAAPLDCARNGRPAAARRRPGGDVTPPPAPPAPPAQPPRHTPAPPPQPEVARPIPPTPPAERPAGAPRPATPGSELVPLPSEHSLEDLDRPWSRAPARAGEGGRLSARDLDAAMTAAAREAWPPITPDDLDASLAAGDRAHVLALADPRLPVSSRADDAAMTAVVDATERAVAVQRLAPRREPGHAEWARAGVVIPVIGAGPGAGASVLAATLFDTLDAAGVRALLVDGADPQRSGLAAAARNQGNPARTLHPDVGVAFARRGEGWMAQLATKPGTVASASMVPSPDWWLPQSTSSPQVTVADLGWDPWALSAAPLRGPGAWLEYGSPAPRPILVVPATRPGLAHANGILERLRPWVDSTRITPMARLVVSGARRWPRDVPGVASALLRPLLADAVFLPPDPQTRIAGVGPDPMSPRLRRAVTPLLTSWGLTFSSGRAPRPMSARPPIPRT